MKPLLLSLLTVLLLPLIAVAGAERGESAAPAPVPQLSPSGALPSPTAKVKAPNSTVFYAIPVIGFWLMLRRRSRTVRF